MNLTIYVNCDQGNVRGEDCGTHIAIILRRLADTVEFESVNELEAMFGDPENVQLLMDTDANVVGNCVFTES
jgi:hypothetical protein